MGLAVCFSLAACSIGGDKAYPVGLDGTEILVGETKMSALYDAGYTIEALNATTRIGRIPMEPSMELEANSIYTGILVLKDEVTVAIISVATDKKAVPASDALIGGIQVSAELDHPLDTITLDGVKLLEMTTDTFQEHVSGCKVREDSTSAYLYGTNYSVNVGYENGVPVSMEMKRKYDVK